MDIDWTHELVDQLELPCFFGERSANHFGGGEIDDHSTDWPLDAAGGPDLLDRRHDAWIAGVSQLGRRRPGSTCGPAEGPSAASPFAALVLHIDREALHHGAEIATTLDLHTHSAHTNTKTTTTGGPS